MANSKISSLTSATTPLAGTETLPIVQSSTTKQVSVANLTAGRTVAMSSLQVNTGGATYSAYATAHALNGFATAVDASNGGRFIGATTAGSELAYLSLGGNYNLGSTGEVALATNTAKKVILGTANVARLTLETSGDVTVNTGNLVIGTSGKGIDFSATPGTGTSELLADYEEGTWTPTVAAITGSYTTVTGQAGTYTKVGRQVTCKWYFVVSNKGTGAGGVNISNLPFASNASAGNFYAGSGYDTSLGVAQITAMTATTSIDVYKYDGTDPVVVTRGQVGQLTYFV
jgi:hypothetical protein